MAPYTKGIVAIAVEDDAILMLHGIVELSFEGCEAMGFSPLEFLPRPLPASSDGLSPEPDQSREALLDWRERAPHKVLDHVKEFISDCLGKDRPVDAVGVAMFGNVSTKGNQSIAYTSSQGDSAGVPQPIEIPGRLRDFFDSRHLAMPTVLIVNDATAMAMGEYIHRKALGTDRDPFVSIWLGKGSNGGVVFEDGRPWHGFMHPEMGHILPRFHEDDEEFVRQLNSPDGITSCVTHKNCFLALVSRRSVLKRQESGMTSKKIEEIIAYYVAQLCLSITLILVPGRIAIGGYLLRSGMLSENLIQKVRENFSQMLNGYPVYTQIARQNVNGYIVPAAGTDTSALRGVVKMLADKLWADHKHDAFQAATEARRAAEHSK